MEKNSQFHSLRSLRMNEHVCGRYTAMSSIFIKMYPRLQRNHSSHCIDQSREPRLWHAKNGSQIAGMLLTSVLTLTLICHFSSSFVICRNGYHEQRPSRWVTRIVITPLVRGIAKTAIWSTVVSTVKIVTIPSSSKAPRTVSTVVLSMTVSFSMSASTVKSVLDRIIWSIVWTAVVAGCANDVSGAQIALGVWTSKTKNTFSWMRTVATERLISRS